MAGETVTIDKGLYEGFIKDQKAIRKYLEAEASKPARGNGNGISAPGAFGGWNNQWGGWQDDRLNQQLKNLAPYDQDSVRMLSKAGRQPRLSGLGPVLCKMAGMAAASISHQPTLQHLREQGLWGDGGSESYGQEQFEREFPGAYGAFTKGWRNVKMADGREVRKTALAESGGQTGGYAIPPQFMNELLSIAAEDGFIEQRAKVVPMNTRTVQWPMLDITTAQALGTSPYFGGILAQWQPEAAQINETEPAFRQTDWTAWDLVLYTVSSNQMLADNGISLDALLTQLFGQAITWYKEFAYLQGRGAGSTMPLGVINAPASYVQNRATAAHFKLQDAAAMMSHLQIRSWDDACWIMHQSVIPELIQMSDVSATLPGTAGQHFSWMTPLGDGKVGAAAMKLPNAFLNGLPLFFTEKVPSLGSKGDVVLCDWSRYVIGMRLDIQIDVSPHFLFRNNQLAWRVIARVDGKPWLNNSVTDAEGWSVSPFVVLN